MAKKEEQKFKRKEYRKALVNKRMVDNRMSMQEAANEIGISKATYSRLEAGKTPDLSTYIKTINWLWVTADYYINALTND